VVSDAAGRRFSLGVLRLRAGLRIGGLLRLGGVRPLGGGVFAGGGRARDLVAGRRRHRLQAALLTLAMLAAGVVGWAVSRESPEAEQAQAAGAGPAAGVPVSTTCAVRYQLRRDSGSRYEALLTVATTAEVGRSPWRVQFSYPGSQRLTSVPKAVTQKGRKVVAKGSGKLRSFTLHGAYRGYNPLPFMFTLDGRRCRAEILGTVHGEAVSGKTGPNRGAGESKRNRPLPKTSGLPPTPPPPTPAAFKGSGISLVL
jgi:serine/threonine-protein kinase